MKTNEQFTIKEAFEIQQGNLKLWKKVLKPEIYERLLIEVATRNDKFLKQQILNPFNVCRGNDISDIVSLLSAED